MTHLPVDLFDFWRAFLAIACTVYTLILTFRWLIGWHETLTRPGKPHDVLRRYLLVQALRLRVGRFRRDLLAVAGWAVVLALLLWYDSRLVAAR